MALIGSTENYLAGGSGRGGSVGGGARNSYTFASTGGAYTRRAYGPYTYSSYWATESA